MNEVNDLNRLKRAGDQDSKTNQKLIEAALRTADLIAKACITTDEDKMGSQLGRNYTILNRENRFCLVLRNGAPRGDVLFEERYVSRDVALKLADDLANGWLQELCEMLEQRNTKSEAALKFLAEADEAILRTSGKK